MGCKNVRVATEEEWRAEHAGHGEPSKQLTEHQPPRGTYRIYSLDCPCGQKLIITESE